MFTLLNYSGTESAIQRRGRKLYFVDGAVRNAALQRGLAPLDDPAELGLLLENLVVATLRSLAVHSGVRLHHWRERTNEVDVIFDHPHEPLAFEARNAFMPARECCGDSHPNAWLPHRRVRKVLSILST